MGKCGSKNSVGVIDSINLVDNEGKQNSDKDFKQKSKTSITFLCVAKFIG